MGKIRNSALKNVHGDGYQKIYTDDNGTNYRIRNSALKNAHGDGYQQIVEKEGASADVPMGGSIFFYISIVLLVASIVSAMKDWECTFPLMIAFIISLVIDIAISWYRDITG